MNLIRKALNNPAFKRYFFNSSWMLAEQFLRIVSGVFVGIYIARYLGPDDFGVLSYIVAISTFLIAISRLGMDAIVVREVVSHGQNEKVIVGTAFWMMLVAALLCSSSMMAFFWLGSEAYEIKVYASILSVSCLFTSLMVVDFYFQSQVKAKYSAICKSLTLFMMSVVKLVLIYYGADVVWFVWASLADFVVLAIVLLVAACRFEVLSYFSRFSFPQAKDMLRSAWPLVLGAVAIQIYMRIDQIMIRDLLGLREVGIYSAAVRIYEAWVVVMVIITISLLPAIISLKDKDVISYHRRLSHLFSAVIWSSVAAAIVVTIFSAELMVLAFGESYRDSASVLNIIMWTGVFAGMGTVSARYFNVEKMEKKFAFRTVLAAAVNVALNFFLIPLYGIKGAAISTLVCTIFANYIMDWFDPDLKVLLKLKHDAIFRPFSRGLM